MAHARPGAAALVAAAAGASLLGSILLLEGRGERSVEKTSEAGLPAARSTDRRPARHGAVIAPSSAPSSAAAPRPAGARTTASAAAPVTSRTAPTALEAVHVRARDAVAKGDRVFLPLLRSDDATFVHALAAELRGTPGPLHDRAVLAGLAAIALDARSPLESRAVAIDLVGGAPGADAASLQELGALARDEALGLRARFAIARIQAGRGVR